MIPLGAQRAGFHGEGASRWLWIVGIVRICMLAVIAAGAYLVVPPGQTGAGWLLAFYGFGMLATAWYLFMARRGDGGIRALTWTLVLADFSVVSATVNFSGGPESFFAFLFVVVILEAGRLLGVREGFVVATLATALVFVECALTPTPLVSVAGAAMWYSFLVQALAFYLSAFISGHWNQQVDRMRQFQREILDNMNNGFLITGPTGIVTAQNKAADRILGMETGAALGRPVQDVLRVEADGECPILTALRAERDFTSYEFQAMTDDGPKWMGLTTSRIYDSARRLTGIIASFSDLTEIAQMRDELKRQDRLAVVGELAAGLAHEIRNPVAAIRSSVEELNANIDARPFAEKLAAIALRESDHLNRIVTDFFDFARKPSMRREAFDVRGLAEEVRDSLRLQRPDCSDMACQLVLPDSPCFALGDRSQIKQVFVNIAKNAVEAMGEKGALTIVVAPGPGFVETRFDDEGPGIDPDKVARIFEPFYTTKATGTGMGLAVCMRIITAHDGAIHVRPREGRGTSMSVRLPAARKDGLE